MNFVRPAELGDALDLLSDGQWTLLAGGTDYYPSLRSEAPRGQVLDITKLTALRGVEEQPDFYRIGALTTWSDIARAALPPAFNALQQAALEVGSVQIQNRASIGGNLSNASPAADGVPPLLILDASVELRSRGATRVIPLQAFIRGNRDTARRADELLSAILIPRTSIQGNSAFLKLGARKYLVISIGMVAARLVVDDNIIRSASIAIGSCSAVAQRVPEVERALEGVVAEEFSNHLVNESLLERLSPISDIRATAQYRLSAVLPLVRRAVAACLEAE